MGYKSGDECGVAQGGKMSMMKVESVWKRGVQERECEEGTEI